MKPTAQILDMFFRAVALFNDLAAIEEAIKRFREEAWTVHEFDCAQFTSQESFLNDILHRTGSLESGHTYESINMLQFRDLLRGYDVPEDTGMLLAFKNLDSFPVGYPEFFQELLQTLACEHYRLLKSRGARFMVCAHIANRSKEFDPLYTIKAEWVTRTYFSKESEAIAELAIANAARHRNAMREAIARLEKDGKPYLSIQRLTEALRQVTGVTEPDALAAMNLEAVEIVRLTADFDFGANC